MRKLGDLHGEAVAGVRPAVDDVHPGDRHDHLLHAGELGEVLVEGHTLLRRTGLGHLAGGVQGFGFRVGGSAVRVEGSYSRLKYFRITQL